MPDEEVDALQALISATSSESVKNFDDQDAVVLAVAAPSPFSVGPSVEYIRLFTMGNIPPKSLLWTATTDPAVSHDRSHMVWNARLPVVPQSVSVQIY